MISRRDFIRISGMAAAAALVNWQCPIASAHGSKKGKDYDAIIIGAGLGGLSCAALLARQGFRPLVLEKNSKPGGYATSFQRGDFTCEASLHGVTGQPLSQQILAQLGIAHKLSFVPHEASWGARYPGLGLDLPQPPRNEAGEADVNQALMNAYQTLVEKFPSEAMGIGGYMACWGTLLAEIEKFYAPGGGMPEDPSRFPVLYPTWNSIMDKTLDDLFQYYMLTNPALKAISGQSWPYYGLPASQIPAWLYLMYTGMYYGYGNFYIQGTSRSLTNALGESIRDAGGKVLLKTEVKEIILDESGRAVGVTARKTVGAKPKERFYYADAVVSNVAVPVTFNKLLSDDVTATLGDYMGSVDAGQPSTSHVNVWLGLDLSKDYNGTFMENYNNLRSSTLVYGGFDTVIPSSTQNAIESLTEKYPEESIGIKKFYKTICAIRKEIARLPAKRSNYFILLPIFPILYPKISFYAFMTVGKFIDSIIKDEDLKLILLANIFYYHDDPYSMSLIYFSAAQASYFQGGTYYIKGGSHNLSNYLAQLIKANDGELIFNNLVTKIITNGKKAIGVEYKSNDNNIHTSYANTVISNAAVPNVASLLDKENRLLLEKRTKKLVNSCSLLCIYIGFKKRIKDLGSNSYSTFVLHDGVKKIGSLKENFQESFLKRSFFFVDYSQIDSDLAPKGKSVGVVCIADYFSQWNELNREDYKKKKDDVAHIFFERLEQLIPGIKNEIEYYEVGTPKTIQKYTLNPEGAVYGFAQLPRQAGFFRLPNKSPIKNLYFASAWVNPGGGFTGAIMSGWFCANEVMKA
ncbi:MAG: FAD-binding protein [Candidatus Electrothrix sp. AUS4]|nr:FAD-binding protein [Candidatus Electrothrix sp. AUS4]